MYPGTHAATSPDRPAAIMAGSGETVSYADLDERSARLASALHDLGLRVGDVIAVLSDNSLEAFEIYWAAMRSGLYVTVVNWHLSDGEAAYIVRDSGARVIIASCGVAELAAQVAQLVPEVEHRFSFGGSVDGYGSYADVLKGAGPRLTDQPRGSEMLYSSSTTGRPKGIKPHLPSFQVDEPGDGIIGLLAHGFGFTDQDVYLSPAPAYHAAPLKWCAGVRARPGWHRRGAGALRRRSLARRDRAVRCDGPPDGPHDVRATASTAPSDPRLLRHVVTSVGGALGGARPTGRQGRNDRTGKLVKRTLQDRYVEVRN